MLGTTSVLHPGAIAGEIPGAISDAGAEEPLVSILMPFYNAHTTIAAAVRSLLNQTHRNWELLLLDDGSTDGSRAIVEALADERFVIWSDSQQKGLAPRLNECIARARGRYIARMDSDDICYPDRLQSQVAFLEGNPLIDIVGCCVMVIDDEGNALGKRLVPETHEQITAQPAAGFGLAHPTWMVRNAWYKIHRYDPAAIRYEDAELLYRTHKTSRFANLPQILLGYRETGGGFQKRLKTRRGRVGYLGSQQAEFGTGMYWKAVFTETWKSIADGLIVLSGQRYATLRRNTSVPSDIESSVWNRVREDSLRVASEAAVSK
ncbi:MAG: glycosyltransferase family 2 protein [Acidobacteriota bacterium]